MVAGIDKDIYFLWGFVCIRDDITLYLGGMVRHIGAVSSDMHVIADNTYEFFVK